MNTILPDPSTAPRILLVEDDPGVVRALVTRLQSIGCLPIVAGTGAQGMAAFDFGGIDLVLTDLRMPVLDGFELVRRIRAVSGVPVLVMTGLRGTAVEALTAVPGVDLLQKPFATADLLTRVAQLLEHREAA